VDVCDELAKVISLVKKHELSSEFGTKFQRVAIIFGETLIFAT